MGWLRLLWRLPCFFLGSALYVLILIVGRQFTKTPVQWRHRMTRRWGTDMVRICGGRIVVRGTPPTPPFVFVSNHLSYVDAPVLLSALDAVFIAKSEVRSWPVFGFLASVAQTIFVDRSRRSDVVRVNQAIADQLSDQKGLILFPEGTSTEGFDVLPFKPSLLAYPASLNLPVYYGSLTYETSPRDIPAYRSIGWAVNGDLFFKHFLRFFQVASFTAVITFGETPVVASDRKVLAQTLWERVRGQFEPMVAGRNECH